jgi:hypothetical protein
MRVTKRKPAATLVVGRALRLLRVIPEPSSPSSYPTELETRLSPTPYRLPVGCERGPMFRYRLFLSVEASVPYTKAFKLFVPRQ